MLEFEKMREGVGDLKTAKWIAIAVMLLSGLSITAVFIFSRIISSSNIPGSIGIIGGADGPTAVFLTSKLFPEFLFIGAIITFIAAALVWLILLRKSKRKS